MMVSVVIPCYNVEDYIEECLQSVFDQTYQNIEVVCVDNNSTDGTLDLLKKHEAAGSIVLLQEPKKGACAARNLGLKNAKGAWIQFLDADDLLLPGKIEHQVGLITSEACFIAGKSRYRERDGRENERSYNTDVFKGLFSNRLGNTCANLWNKEQVDVVDGWDESLPSSQETDLMFRLLQRNENVLFDPSVNTIIRKRDSGQISQTDPGAGFERYVKGRVKMLEYVAEKKPDYFVQNKQWYYQHLFDSIRVLANFDLDKGVELFKQHIPSDFVPEVSPVTGKAYLFLYKLFGFHTAQRIKRVLGSKHEPA